MKTMQYFIYTIIPMIELHLHTLHKNVSTEFILLKFYSRNSDIEDHHHGKVQEQFTKIFGFEQSDSDTIFSVNKIGVFNRSIKHSD